VTSVVLGTDLVARLSVHAMATLREEVLDCIGKYTKLNLLSVFY
jgi:septum formation topological specificity factor MinE